MIEQGTIEWKLLRCGKISASRISDILAKGRNGAPSVTREGYMYDLAVERLTGIPTESFTSTAMQWGVDNEPLARAAYEIKTGRFVSQVPFVFHPNIPNGGCSPDGLVDDDFGAIEIKCPMTKTHLKWIIADKPAEEYVNQMMWQMACTGRQYVDFVSFDPRLPDDLQLFIRRLDRDDEYIDKITQEVIKFDQEVEVLLTKLKEINNV